MEKQLEHRLCKDEHGGYYVDFIWDGLPLVTGKAGELHLLLENEDRSLRETLSGWKAQCAEAFADGVELCGTVKLPRFMAELSIAVKYRRVNNLCYEKTIRLKQCNLPVLFFSVQTPLTAENAAHLWSFDNARHAGGIVHGTFPAIGFTSEGGVSAGLLTDAGHRNLWTRNLRRRPTPGSAGFTAIQRLCDGKMLTLQDNTAALQLGLLTDYRHGAVKEQEAPAPEKWLCMEGSSRTEAKFSAVQECGGYLPYSLEDGFYTFSFDYKSKAPIEVRILKNSPGGEVRAFHYQDPERAENCDWAHFEDSFFLSDTEGLPSLVHIFEREKEGAGSLELKNIKMLAKEGEDSAYHPLRLGKTEERRLFLFAQQGDDIRSLRLASQLRLAEGLGFTGSETEKALFAGMQAMTWIAGETDFTPHNVPNINYAPDMYNRDSFWSVAGVDDKALSQAIFERWGDTQTEEGGIGTIVTPCMGSVEVKDNEASCEWLWWALLNKTKYGLPLPQDKIEKAWHFCVNHFDPHKTGICEAHFVMGQNDVATYPDEKKTRDLSVNQGVWAVTLKAAKALGQPVEDAWIRAAVDAYRSFYDEKRGYLLNDRLHPYAISVGDLMPEFASLWLFREPMLSDDMVCRTLDRVPREKEFAFFIGHVEDRYFNDTTKTCDEKYVWPNGIYYNGGSWLREEAIAYAAGAMHGWPQAKERFLARMEGEIHVNPEEPFGHEYIPTDLNLPNCWSPGTRMLCWNVFALRAKEVAGI